MAMTAFVFSCTFPRRYEIGKPYVYKVKIEVDGKLPNDEKQDLANRLANQLDDSMRVGKILVFKRMFRPGKKSKKAALPFIYRELQPPPVFDTANVTRSNNFMIALLNAIGYYNPLIKDTFKIDTIKDRYQAIVTFKVNPGKNLKIDSIGYDLQTTELQKLALENQKNSFLKRGNPFSKQIVSAELERLITLFRNNGYYKFSIKDIYAERDTVLSALIDPTLDPFQQAQLLEELRRKRENPTINVVIKQRPPQDSSELKKYHIDSVTVFPDLPLIEDTAEVVRNDSSTKDETSVISRTKKFRNQVIYHNLAIHPGDLYKLDSYYKTLNIFGNQMGAWQRATLDFGESQKADSLLNATIRLYPAKKQTLSAELEASYNTNDILTATNLFGLGGNISLRNRNAFRSSIQTNTSIHAGVEFGADFIQTTQASFSHTVSLPQSPSFWWFKNVDNRHTALNLNASFTDRRDFFTLRSIETYYGWEWTTGNRSFILRPINLEYNDLTPTDSLNHLLDTVPSLKLAFKTGLVISTQFIYSSTRQYGKHTDFLRMQVEPSGGLIGLFDYVNNGALLRFVKGDIEYRHHIDYKKTELAFRFFGGAGLKYGAGKGTNQTLPLYKAFFAGGPNSMRGWQVRQLGLGSTQFYDTGVYSRFDRFGDIKLEGNIEYRFPIGSVYGIKVKSAVYTDFGNIWNWKITDTDPQLRELLKGSDFAIDRFYNEIAVDIGTGLRLDFDYFIIRFDWAYKIRDPQRLDYPNRWFYDMHLKDGQFQLGIGYPF
ncbi:MAG TPA: BamA/TamA family outer membrane protein [Puia sp.]|nr:BamA/TamA family outer membrane protein [Puia sp.]